MQMLQEVVYLPEYEASDKCYEEALSYMAQWDCGEYTSDPIPRSDLGSTAGRAYETDENMHQRYPD